MLAAVMVAQRGDYFGVGDQRDVFRALDGIKIRNEWNGQPIVARDAVVATEDHARFPGQAAAQHGGRFGANPAEIDGRMPGARKGSVITVGFFKQKGDIGAGLRQQTEAEEQRDWQASKMRSKVHLAEGGTSP